MPGLLIIHLSSHWVESCVARKLRVGEILFDLAPLCCGGNKHVEEG